MKKINKFKNTALVSMPAVEAVTTDPRTLAGGKVQITTAQFWKTIAKVRGSWCPEVALAAALRNHTMCELISFRDHFDYLVVKAYTWQLWAAADLIVGGCSDDGFEYFRYGLISKGQKAFAAANKDPDALADFDPGPYMVNETFGYVARFVYEMWSGGHPMPPSDPQNWSAEPSGDGPAFGDVKSYRRCFPKLWTKFGSRYKLYMRG